MNPYTVRPFLGAAALVAAQVKGYKAPAKWSKEVFRKKGKVMRFALARTAKIVARKAYPAVRVAAKKVMMGQIEAALVLAQRRFAAGKAITVNVADEAVWLEAFNDVFAVAGGMLEAELVPPLQSVVAQGMSKTEIVLGLESSAVRAASLRGVSLRIAQRITRIDEHTRAEFRRAVVKGLAEEGSTIRDVADSIRDTMTDVTERRIRVIARTETANAWNAGSIAAMRDLPGVKTVDVIGCESREKERWGQPSFAQYLYRGEGTCNIRGVPIEDAHKLNFHPNHTGAIVPGSVG